MPASILRALSADEVRCLILMVLQLQLYEDFYCPGMALATTDFVLLQEVEVHAFGNSFVQRTEDAATWKQRVGKSSVFGGIRSASSVKGCG